MHINVFIQKNLSLVIIRVAFMKVYGFLHYLLRLICTSKKQNVDMSNSLYVSLPNEKVSFFVHPFSELYSGTKNFQMCLHLEKAPTSYSWWKNLS